MGQHLDAFGRAVVELVVIAAEHGIQATNGLVAMQYIVWRVHAAFSPAAEVGHEVFLIAAVQSLAVDPHIGTWDTFEGNDQHVACASRCRQ
ncbi:hypothetical protein D3C79_702740 [compost metagenome]